MNRIVTSASMVIFALMLTLSVNADNVPEPEGYRQTAFRAPVPATLNGARVVDAKAAHILWSKKQALFIDVLPRPPQPKNIKDPAKWKVPKRFNIKDSVWLPNVGFGELHPDVETYFKHHLKRLSAGDVHQTLAFYCKANCWMSWNAAKRALSYGYTNIIWFPGGTDDWEKAEYPLEEKLPEK